MVNYCPICNNKLKIKYKIKNKIYWCVQCNLLLSDIQINDKNNFEMGNSETLLLNSIKELRKRNFTVIVNHIKTLFPGKVKGLEVGSSYGWFLQIAKQSDMECIGIEPEKYAANIASLSNCLVFQGFFPQDIPENLDKFDYIIFNDVFEHIQNCTETLTHCYNLLKDNGILILNLPLSSGIIYKISRLVYFFGVKSLLNRLWQFNFYSPHYYYFNKNNLIKIARLKGFDIIDYHKLDSIDKECSIHRIDPDGHYPKIANFFSRIIKNIIPLINLFPEDIGCFYFRKSTKPRL